MSITLGRVPESLVVLLVASDPFVCTLELDGGQTWAALGSTPVIEIGAEAWTSTAVGAKATFNVAAAQVQAVIDAKERHARLTLGGLVWASGRVSVRA